MSACYLSTNSGNAVYCHLFNKNTTTMKKNLLHLLTPICAATLSYLPVMAQWQHVGTPNFAAGAVKYTSMVLSRDTPVVAYRDNSAGGAGRVSVMRYDGIGWGAVGNTGFTANRVKEVSLAADSATGQLYVAYQDTVDGIHVDKFDGINWVNVGGTGYVANAQADEITMLVAGDGTPYIGYRDGNQSYKANVMKYTGGSWQQVGNADISGAASAQLAFAIDHYGRPYAVSEYSSAELIQVQRFDGSTWVDVGQSGFDTASYATPVSIAIGDNNQPYVALSYHDSHYPVKAWTYNGSSWILIGGQPATGTYAEDVRIAVNHQNVPVITYADYNGNYQLSARYYNGSTWVPLGPADFTTGEADYAALAINSRNDVYVGYEDFGNSNGATVDIYLHNVGVHEVPGLEGFSLYPNPSRGKYQISFSQEQAGEVSLIVSDMTGRIALQRTESNSRGKEVLDLTGLAPGTYALQVKTATGMENRLLELQ